MPRHRIDHSTEHHDLPEEFPERLKRSQRESGLSWVETYRSTVRRWAKGRTRPKPSTPEGASAAG